MPGRHPDLSDYTFMQKCLHELELLGYMISGNILDILPLHAGSRNAVPLLEAPKLAGKRIKVFGRAITERIHAVMPKGKPMKFLTLEDASGCMDVIFWPDTFEKYADILLSGGPFEIWGRVTEDWDAHCLEAHAVKASSWTPNQIDFSQASQKLEASYRRFKTYDDIPQIRAA
jgi:DNA polymerase III alpha subunit